MKRFIKIITTAFIITVLITVMPFESTCSRLQSDVLRLHIIANSDSKEDQSIKLMVRDNILNEMSPLYNSVKTKDQAIAITEQNLELIKKTALQTVRSCGYDYSVNVRITNKYFSTRYYDEFTMPAGMYDTLEITLGESKGHNWWCVMYPTLCVGAATKEKMKENLTNDEYTAITSDDIEYKFKIVEYYEKICSFFR